MLTAEVDHRAKNVLALVKSLVRQTEAKDARAFAESILGRVSSLAHAHTLLAKERWQGTDLRLVLEGEFAPYRRDSTPNRISLLGEPVRLPAAAVQPLAMVIHELTTNAAKYGALSVPSGQVAVCWTLRPEPTGRASLCLRWSETGGPRIDVRPSRAGFGSALIEGTVASQLDGELDMNWRSSGLECVIRIPFAETSDA